MDVMELLTSTLIQGLIYALISYGVYITYSILDFPDLGVDGTFPLGAAVTAVLMTKGVDPWLTLPASLIVGGLAGLFTGLVHVKLKVRNLLAGIITMTALFSVNLQIAGSNLTIDTGTRLARGLRKFGPLRFLGSPQGTTAVVLGSVLYKLCIQVAMSLGLPTNMMKLITAALFLLVLVLSGRKGEAIIHA